MNATITNCYIGGAGTSAIAQRVLRSASAAQYAPSDFFSRELFNISAGGDLKSRIKSKISKVDLLKLLHGRNSSTDGE